MTENNHYEWKTFTGEHYEKYVNQKAMISEKEALANYDEILKDIKKTVSAHNYTAMMQGKPLEISTEDLTYYLRPHNEWAKKSNWSPELRSYMRNRGFFK
jgi:nitrate reductase alpha subunit